MFFCAERNVSNGWSEVGECSVGKGKVPIWTPEFRQQSKFKHQCSKNNEKGIVFNEVLFFWTDKFDFQRTSNVDPPVFADTPTGRIAARKFMKRSGGERLEELAGNGVDPEQYKRAVVNCLVNDFPKVSGARGQKLQKPKKLSTKTTFLPNKILGYEGRWRSAWSGSPAISWPHQYLWMWV